MVNIKKTRESTKKKINSALPQNITDNSDKNYKSTIITPIGQERAIEVENNTSNLDIAPTIYHVLGLDIPSFVEGEIIGPPQDKEYAVEPVGVEMINPSALYSPT